MERKYSLVEQIQAEHHRQMVIAEKHKCTMPMDNREGKLEVGYSKAEKIFFITVYCDCGRVIAQSFFDEAKKMVVVNALLGVNPITNLVSPNENPMVR